MVSKVFYLGWLVFIGSLFSQYAYGEATSGEKLIGSLLASPEMCGKTATPLNGGKHHGRLKDSTSVILHYGPSVICPNIGTLTKSDQFVIIGRTQSAFGKPWFKIELLKNSKKAWVPSQLIIQGKKVAIPKYTSKDLKSTKATANLDLNVRECPDTNCTRIGSLKKDVEYTVLKSADNGWYYVQMGEDENGWASGKYLTAVDYSPLDKELIAGTEKKTATATGSKPIKSSSTDAAQAQAPQTNIKVVTSPSTQPKKGDKSKQRNVGSANSVRSSGISRSSSTPSTALKSLQKATGRNVSTPPPKTVNTIDQCSTRVDITKFREKTLWRVEKEFVLNISPHEQCGKQITLIEGKAIVSVGESEEYYFIAAVPDDALTYGYLLKGKYTDQYVPMRSLHKSFKVNDSKDLLLYYEEHWNSFEYRAWALWEKFEKLYVSNLALSICITSFVLGMLMLPFGWSRRFMLRLDQFILRLTYFTVRSPNFWRMIRKLTFILLLTAAIIGVIFLYVLWIMNVASQRQQIMGAASLALISTSIGWFGARVAGFFTGLLLFFLSFVEFLLFTAFLFFLFLAPSLLLLLAYYVSYRRKAGKRRSPARQFDNAEIERIHGKMFQLRNFYPETIIRWARHDTLNEHWQQFKDVMQSKTSSFDRFFNSFGTREASAS